MGATYWPADVGPYLWHEFSAATVARDLRAIAAHRTRVVRVLLSWDAFMPTDRAPNPRRMRDFEGLLRDARELGMQVVPTLFAQSLGDCVMLPAYAVDRRAPRRGVRCITDGRVVPGGPRDMYAHPLMLEVQVRCLDAMLAAFAHHPAIAAWDLGLDPARTVRPRRIEDMRAWATLLAERVHDHEEECRLTLGQGDFTAAHGVRPHLLARAVDRLGLVLRPQRLDLIPGAGMADDGAFLAALALAMVSADTALAVDLGVSVMGSADTAGDDRAAADRARPDVHAILRDTRQLMARLLELGVSGVTATSWADWGVRLAEAPPGDRAGHLLHEGIVDSAGISTALGAAWDELTAKERTTVEPAGSLVSLVGARPEEYYANLPDSLLELRSVWEDRVRNTPAILGEAQS